MTFGIHGKRGQLVRRWCVECRKSHAKLDCPALEWRIIQALDGPLYLGSSELWYRKIAADLGIPWRRVQNTVGRLMRKGRSRIG